VASDTVEICMDDAAIDEQIAYYRQRAAEYDITSTPPGDSLRVHGEQLDHALDAFAPRGDVLEIASGTGIWTEKLLRHASRVDALDAAAEMHDVARDKIGDDPRVAFIVGNVFAWRPHHRYDVVFFANWLSHVPRTLFGPFWDVVATALRPGGRVFFVDELFDAWRHEKTSGGHVDGSDDLVSRQLLDGRSFRVVKVFRPADALEDALTGLGWSADIHAVGPFFWATAHRG